MVQGMVEEGGLIRRTPDDCSSSLGHSLLIMAVSFLMFSLKKVASIVFVEWTGTGSFLMQGYFEVFPKSSKRSSSNFKGSSEC
jgi:hypothetical protein